MSRQMRMLNAYPEWRNNNSYNTVSNFIQNDVIPAHLNNRQRNTFINKFQHNFIVNNNHIYYQPPLENNPANHRLSIKVLRPTEHENALNEIYQNIQRGLGEGQTEFYHQVCQSYIGITRKEAVQFLKKHSDYQLTRPIKKTVNKPIITRASNERWQIDVIDLTAYRQLGGWEFVMTTVDCYSGKVWLRALKHQTAQEATDALQNVINESHTTPHSIQTDNGGSFLDVFHQFCRNNHIKHIYSLSHSPSTNGKVERCNQEVRKLIKAGFVRNNNLQWFVHLQDYAENMNNQISSVTKHTANQLWTQGYHAIHEANMAIDHNIERPADTDDINEVHRYVQTRKVLNALHQIQHINLHHFQVGDLVRVKLDRIAAEMRARNKNGILKKRTAITYSPVICRVRNVLLGDENQPAGQPVILNNNQLHNIQKTQYELETAHDDHLLVNANGNSARFYAADLMAVTNNVVPGAIPNTMAGYNRSRVINKFV